MENRIAELMVNPTPRVNQAGESDVSELTIRALFDSEETGLLRYAFSLVGRRAVAEEIVQEVFLQLHVHWNEVESPRAWLFRSVRNRVFNYIRKNRREVFGAEQSDEPDSGVRAEAPEELLQRMEATGVLRRLLEELSETDQQLIKLKYFEGLKYREIAERTELSISNVGYRLHHVLKELARKLRRIGIDEIE